MSTNDKDTKKLSELYTESKKKMVKEQPKKDDDKSKKLIKEDIMGGLRTSVGGNNNAPQIQSALSNQSPKQNPGVPVSNKPPTPNKEVKVILSKQEVDLIKYALNLLQSNSERVGRTDPNNPICDANCKAIISKLSSNNQQQQQQQSNNVIPAGGSEAGEAV